MIRTFQRHKIRKVQELTGALWDFRALSGKHAGELYRMATPCCWESHMDFADYRGEGVFTTRFTGEGNVRMVFKGVSHTATVALDGREIARHYNAYTAFDVIVRDLAPGEHILSVKADNGFSGESALHVPNDYMSYGGVSRPVAVEQLGNVFIRQIHVTPRRTGGCWTAKVELVVANVTESVQSFTAEAVIGDERALWTDLSLEGNGETVLTKELSIDNAREWSVEEPNLTLVAGMLFQNGEAVDDLIDRFGFREIGIEGESIVMNGKPLRIRGLCRHEDHPQFGCAIPYEAMAADLMIFRDLGANSVRTAHYPNDERFLDLCDELGILVWEENHARGLSEEQMRNPHFEEQCEQVIREMVPDHYNHPSIYIWGILNECASDTSYGRDCYEKQFTLIRSLDDSRPVSFASCRFKTDICLDLPDVVSYNIYPLWYHDTPPEEYMEDLYRWVQTAGGAGKPYLITEIGAGSIYGFRAVHKPKWSEEYQAEALDRQLAAVLSHPHTSGVYIWQFCDCRISEECFAGRPRTMNNKGVVDEYRRRKLCYDVVKRHFRQDICINTAG